MVADEGETGTALRALRFLTGMGALDGVATVADEELWLVFLFAHGGQ